MQAKVNTERALQIHKDLLGEISYTHVDFLDRLAATAAEQGDLHQAANLAERSLFIRQELEVKIEKPDPNVARIAVNLGDTYKRLGQDEKAAHYFEFALARLPKTPTEPGFEALTAYIRANLKDVKARLSR